MPQLIVSGYVPAIVLTVTRVPDSLRAEVDYDHTFVESSQRVIRHEGIIRPLPG